MDTREDASHNHWRRATFACARCHRRKVRCNIAASGPPCTNCRLDDHDCAVRPQSAVRATRYLNELPFIHVSRRAKAQLPLEEKASIGGHAPSSATHGPVDSHMDDWHHESSLTSPDGNTAEVHSIETAYSIETAHNLLDDRVHSKLVPFCLYPYLRARCLHQLEQEDVAFLQSQNSLMIPMKPFLNVLVSHYFLYVHPLFPIVDEEQFWSMYRMKCGNDVHMSLLVFQAMMFVSCSYIPLAEAKKYGVRSILELRNSFYRRAKLLYDFGAEDDPLSLAQAAALLTHQSTDTNYSSNSTWLAVAIQNARAARSHLYDGDIGESPYKRSDLKRLWWSLAIRDRILAVGMRRPLQIPPAAFDFASREPLLPRDLSGETTTSSVYGPATKTILFKMLTNLCLLVVAVTNLVQMVYPADSTAQGQKEIIAHLSAMAEIRNDLSCWKARAIRLSSRDIETHKSIPFYDRLVYLYYETARLTLYHHTPPWLHQSPAQESQSELIETMTAINDMMQEFSANNTVEQLPLSVLAHTALPQMVVSFGRRLALDAAGPNDDEDKTLNIYEELNSQCRLRFGISHISIWAAKSLRLLSSSTATSPAAQSGMEVWFSERPSSRGVDHSHLLYSHPGLYYQLANIIDSSLAGGKPVLEKSPPLLLASPRDMFRRLEFVRDPRQTVAALHPPQPSLSSSSTSSASNSTSRFTCDYEKGQVLTTETPTQPGSFRPQVAVYDITGDGQWASTLENPFDMESVVEKESSLEYDDDMVKAVGTGTIWDQVGLFGA